MKRGLGISWSPALVVAVVALVVAVGGTAVAGVATLAKLNKVEKKQVRKIAKAESDRRITQRAPDLSVSSAKTAGSAGSATSATNANHATDAGTANGVRPVKVAFSAPAGSSKTLLAEGGITISVSCDGLGRTEVRFDPTPGGGVLDVVRTSGTESTTKAESFNQSTFTSGFGVGTAGFGVVVLLTTTYVGTSGTTITGNLTLAQGASIAQCVVDGTLFVG